MDQGRHMVLLLIIHMMLLWRWFRITKNWRSSLENNFLHKLKYGVQFNIPTYLVKLLCFISFDNSKLLVYEYSKTIDWIGGCIGTVEHQTSQCSPPVKTIDGSAEHHSRVGESSSSKCSTWWAKVHKPSNKDSIRTYLG